MNKVKKYFVGLFNALLGKYPHEELKELARLRREKLEREYPELIILQKQTIDYLLKPPAFTRFRDRKIASGVDTPTQSSKIIDDCFYSGLQRQIYDDFQGGEQEKTS